MSNKFEMLEEAVTFLKDKIQTDSIDIAVIIGTGLSGFGNALDGIDIPYEDIPNFPVKKTSSDHCGKLTFTNIADKKILFFQGRLHYYEGYSINEVVFPIRVMSMLNVKQLIITNSAACLSRELTPGELMIIKDHINLMGVNPLVGQKIPGCGSRFVDMSEPYSKRLNQILKQSSPIALKEGVYVGTTGPNFETPAEVKFFKAIGGSAVGMSTVSEAIVAKQCGIETVGISCISNYAAGVAPSRLNHDSVVEIAKKTETDLVSVILNLIAMIS